MLEAPDCYSKKNKNLQLAWDATSLKTFSECPRKYQYQNLQGWQGSKIDLEFGIFTHEADAIFWRARLAGWSVEQAMEEAVGWALKATWDKKTNKPWGGSYVTLWHCTGTEPYKNANGNKAKCPYAKVGVWNPGTHPSVCGECGSLIEEECQYVAEHKKKNRITLIREVVWYCLEQPEVGGLQPFAFPDGTAAVELPFRVALPMQFVSTGEQPILCGYLDRIAEFSTEHFIADKKTTAGYMDDKYFNSFSPGVQFDTYDLVGSILFPDLDLQGVLIDAAAMTMNDVKFARRTYYKTEATRQEHLEWIEATLLEAEDCATKKVWPMRKSSCWNCQFNKVCQKDPGMRQHYLKAEGFKKQKRWNPLEER